MVGIFRWVASFLSPSFIPLLAAAAPAIMGAVASAGASYLANRASARSANSAQSANLEQAQQFNAQEAALARQFNAEEAEKQRIWSAEQANRQMYFQADQSATAVRRSVQDMRAAGLNPILAASPGGGASTPSGAMGQASAASGGFASSPGPLPVHRANLSGSIPDLLNSALTAAQVQQVVAQTQRTKAEERKLNVETEHLGTDFLRNDSDEIWPKSYTAEEKRQRIENLRADAALTASREKLTDEEANLVRQEIKNAVEENRRIKADTGRIGADAVLKRLASAEAEAHARFYRDNPTLGEWISPLKDLGSILNDAASAAGRSRGVRIFNNYKR